MVDISINCCVRLLHLIPILLIPYLCLGSRKWFSVYRKLFLSTTIVCVRCSWCPGFPTDVGCYGKTVHLTGCFSRSFLVTRNWLFNSLRTWVSSRVRCSVTSANEICCGPHTPIVLADLGGDVERVLLGSGVVGRCPLRHGCLFRLSNFTLLEIVVITYHIVKQNSGVQA